MYENWINMVAFIMAFYMDDKSKKDLLMNNFIKKKYKVEHHHVCSSCSARYFKIFLIKKALVYICVCICNSEMSRSDWSIRFNEVILRDSYWSEEVYSPNCMQHLFLQN